MKKIFYMLLITHSFISNAQNSFPLFSSGAYSGGSTDFTDVTNPQLKLQSTTGYVRVSHLSQNSTVSSVFNFQTGKNIYWGEPGDLGSYFFRGRNLVVENGNVGIGNGSPQATLDVLSSAVLGSTTGNYALLNRFASSGGNGGNSFYDNSWLYRDASGDNWLTARLHKGISIDGSYNAPGVSTRTWWERDPFNNIQSWGDTNQTYLTINQGNVGVGTTTPQFLVHLKNPNGGAALGLERGGKLWRFDLDYTEAQKLYIGHTDYNSVMVLTKEGNIGVGTINPNQKLTVNGTIYGKEVKVDLNVPGPDYVFEENYNLPSLTETESYIKQNKHLPEVPSAKDMETNGINLSEMNMILLKKIEELTLHLIEMKKENEAVMAKMISMQNEINNLNK